MRSWVCCERKFYGQCLLFMPSKLLLCWFQLFCVGLSKQHILPRRLLERVSVPVSPELDEQRLRVRVQQRVLPGGQRIGASERVAVQSVRGWLRVCQRELDGVRSRDVYKCLGIVGVQQLPGRILRAPRRVRVLGVRRKPGRLLE